jgi:hypothetical protein
MHLYLICVLGMTGTMDWKLMRIMWWFPFLMQMKQLAQMQQQQQQQQPPPTLQQQQQDRLAAVSVDVSNSFRTNDPAYGGLEPSPSTNSTGMVKVWMSVPLYVTFIWLDVWPFGFVLTF